MDLQNAMSVIESCAGFTDDSTPAGEAWSVVQAEIERLLGEVRALKQKSHSDYLERTDIRNRLNECRRERRAMQALRDNDIQDIERLREQLREQTKSFCTHCGKLFPKGRDGIAAFREHIAECNEHPLHPMAKQLDECRRLLREACDSIDRAVKPFDDGKSYLASMPDFLNEEWHKRAIVQAARAAGGEE